MLDSPDGVCPGQARFEYPATSVLFSNYYLYISDAKLDMLYGQIPNPILKRLAREATIDLKVLKLSLRDEPTEANRYGRLSVVSKHLARNAQVTGLDQPPGGWLHATIPLRWARANDAVFFAGSRGINVVGLVGSIKHVLGGFRPDGTPVGGTAATIMEIYNKRGATGTDAILDEGSLSFVEELVESMAGGEQRMEFLAKTIDYKPSAKTYGRRVVLATPLYVALSS